MRDNWTSSSRCFPTRRRTASLTESTTVWVVGETQQTDGICLTVFRIEKKLEIGEHNLAKIPERMPNKEPDLTTALENVNHSAVEAYFRRIYWVDIHACCNLINGKKGITSSGLQDKLWWGGGILTIGKGFEGELKGEKFGPGEIADARDSATTWTGFPHTIPHLQKPSPHSSFQNTAVK
ncbi:unnamed protein product [Trypanosoma congolense IL3000]|uniref:WGS project CAEQ00000000 data, annotated contig 2425 n=1 Tax=Trypanosoma congolense (strain IL3000) TaxID=1068625 RepID=F9WE14_TRYCI|nr:unnamed protein product [Trypanosoma congolense IL3000]